MGPQLEIQIIAVIVAVGCALPGVFLVLRQMSMMSDSITHTILLGIVLAFFVTGDLSSPALIIGAALMGVITVWLTETAFRTRLLSKDSAIGIVFPLLFSIAIILITRYAGSSHLDADAVLLGELAFAPFDRLTIFGIDIGAKAIFTSGILLIINVAAIVLFFKELKVVTFDPVLAAVIGISPIAIHYGLMTLVSLTAVGSFESVGSVLVVAFMIVPPSAAYLLTDDLRKMLVISGLIGAASGILGYQLASALDVSIAGSMACVAGALFAATFIFAPKRGLISSLIMRRKRKGNFAAYTLLLHLYHHTGRPDEDDETGVDLVSRRLNWDDKKIAKIIKLLERDGRIYSYDGLLKLTELGTQGAEKLETSLCDYRLTV